MKHFLLFLFTICLFDSLLFAQQLSPVVLASNGGTGQAGNVQLEWTLGELAIEGQTSQQHVFTEGFHQPIRLIEQVDITASGSDSRNDDLPLSGVTLSPNPVSSELLIRFNSTTSGQMTCHVLDANGNPHLQKTLNTSDGETQLDLSGLGPGLFFIQLISTDDGAHSLFKLIKIN